MRHGLASSLPLRLLAVCNDVRQTCMKRVVQLLRQVCKRKHDVTTDEPCHKLIAYSEALVEPAAGDAHERETS